MVDDQEASGPAVKRMHEWMVKRQCIGARSRETTGYQSREMTGYHTVERPGEIEPNTRTRMGMGEEAGMREGGDAVGWGCGSNTGPNGIGAVYGRRRGEGGAKVGRKWGVPAEAAEKK